MYHTEFYAACVIFNSMHRVFTQICVIIIHFSVKNQVILTSRRVIRLFLFQDTCTAFIFLLVLVLTAGLFCCFHEVTIIWAPQSRTSAEGANCRLRAPQV